MTGRTHVVIPDTQSKPGTPSEHLTWIGKFILERKPDVVVHLGDHWDMPSLSSYDKGKKEMEGRRYAEDVEKGNADLALLTAPLRKDQARRLRKGPAYEPRLVLLRGNHEHRIQRAIEDNAQLEGAIGYDDLESPGWEVHDYLKPVWVDGVAYCHTFTNPMTGKPLGGMISTRLKTLGHSFTQGHQQVLDTAIRFVHGPNGPVAQRGLVAGAAYLHTEKYLGFQGNDHWRGIIVKFEVADGGYCLMELSMDFLCRKYEGVPLVEFMQANYPEMTP